MNKLIMSHMFILASIWHLLKSPPIILRNPVFKNNFSTWYTAYWLVPTVSNPSVHIPQVETLKSVKQWHIALKQRTALSLIHLHATGMYYKLTASFNWSFTSTRQK